MAKEIKAYEVDLTELRPDPNNANKGSERGQYMIDTSIADTGLHRGVAVDARNYLVAGNKTHQAAVDAGFTKAIVVETDGDTLVVTKRRDFDLLSEDPENKARRAAYFDNRSAEVSISWSPEVVFADMQAGIDLSGMFYEDELAAILATVPKDDEWVDAFGALPNQDRAPFRQMTFTLHDSQAEQVEEALRIAKAIGDFVDSPNENSNGNALARICETFVTEHGQR